MSPSTPPPPEGRPYGKYLLYEAVGVGARGVVYKAYESAIERWVALRILHKPGFDEPADDAAFSERARADAQAAARLMHPGIAAVYEFAEDGHDIVVASEFVQGWPLAHALAGRLPLGPSDVLCVAKQLLEALAHAHEAGVAHCHLGPQGVLLGKSGHTRVTGFGSARLALGLAAPSASTLARRAYTAPECLDGHPAATLAGCMAADLYACGALLRELMLHAMPTTPAEQDAHRAALPHRLEPVWQHACALQPQARPASARQMLAELLAAADLPVPGMVRLAPAQAPAPISLFPLSDGPATGPTTTTGDREATIAILSRMAGNLLRSGAGVAASSGSAAGASSGAPSVAASGSASSGAVARSAGTVPPPTAPRSGGLVSGSPSGSGGGEAGWDHDAAGLQALTDVLTRLIGPVAVVLVRRHAATAPSLRDLAARLADEALAPEDRDAFFAQVARLPGLGGRPRAAPAATPSGTTSTTGAPREALPADWLERVSHAAMAHMGPVARVLVRQAAAQAASRAELVQRVLEQVDDDLDRAALAKVLARVV